MCVQHPPFIVISVLSSSLRACRPGWQKEAGRERLGGESNTPGRKESEFTQQQGGEIKDDFYFLYLEENSLPGRGAGAERCQPRIMTCLTDRETHTHTQFHTNSHAQPSTNTLRLKHTQHYTHKHTQTFRSIFTSLCFHIFFYRFSPKNNPDTTEMFSATTQQCFLKWTAKIHIHGPDGTSHFFQNVWVFRWVLLFWSGPNLDIWTI